MTQERLLVCSETVAGRVMTRTVMDAWDKKDILSVQSTGRSIRIKTPRAVLTLRGAGLGSLEEAFRNALAVNENPKPPL